MNNIEIDEKKILELKYLLEDSFSMLIMTFIQDTQEKITNLENHIQQRKFIEISRVAHSMKGSCANMGAKHLYSLILELENASKVEDYQLTQKSVILIRDHYPILKQILEKMIS